MSKLAGYAFAAATLTAPAWADAQTFSFEADNPSGSGQHAGSVTVSETAQANVYDVVWTVPEGSLKGVAFVDEGTDTIYASYQLDGVPGLVVLKEGHGHEWAGAWYQGGRTGKEVWTPAK